jgi:hypothetical protein
MDLCKTVLTGHGLMSSIPSSVMKLGDGVARELFGLTAVSRS